MFDENRKKIIQLRNVLAGSAIFVAVVVIAVHLFLFRNYKIVRENRGSDEKVIKKCEKIEDLTDDRWFFYSTHYDETKCDRHAEDLPRKEFTKERSLNYLFDNSVFFFIW